MDTSDSGSSAAVDSGSDRVTRSVAIDVGRIVAIEEHEPAAPARTEFGGHVRHRAEVGCQLDGDGNRHARGNLPYDLHRPPSTSAPLTVGLTGTE